MAIDVTEDMVREAYAEDGEKSELLVTIEADGLAAPLRVTSHAGGLTSTGKVGLISRGEDFLFFPFRFKFGGAGSDEPVRGARLEIGNTDGEIALAIRTASGEPEVTIEVVRPSEPDIVERALLGAVLADAEVDGAVVIGNLKPLDLAGEPACHARYIIARVPGLF